MSEIVFFESASQFRAWLSEHASDAVEISVGYYKLATGRSSLTWSDSVDEAICFGWIDGVRRRVDEQRYTIRFTPRKPNSIWSAINIAKVAKLRQEGRMTPAGELAYGRRIIDKSAVYAHERAIPPELAPEEWMSLQENSSGWQYFESCPVGYRMRMLHWVTSAKRTMTRSSRLSKLVVACIANERLP